MKKALLLAGLVLACTPTLVTAQESSNNSTVSAADLVLEHYSPRYVNANSLYKLALGMVGRNFYVEERGRSNPVSNLAILGDELIVYDTAANTARVLKALGQLDVEASSKSEAESYETKSLRPQHIGVGDAYLALTPFLAPLENGRVNVTLVAPQRLLVLRDTPERLAQMTSALNAIDVPEPQVQVTCMLLKVTKSSADTNVPEELAKELAVMLPDLRFESAGLAIVRTGIVPDRQVSVSTRTADNVRYELTFTPVAYDSESGSVSARSCRVDSIGPYGGETLLSTDTSFRGGAYTVLGASGAEPVLMVVRVDRAK